MIGYGVTKILQTQFVILPFHVWQQPLEDVWGGSLAWAFLSYSPWFQVLLGFCELVPALLLLFRRTALLGAIFMLPLTASVMLINFGLQLWPSTQALSCVLFVLNMLVFVFERHKVQHMVTVIMGKKQVLFKTLPEMLINIGVIGFLLFVFSYPLLQYRSQQHALFGNWFGQHPNEWILQEYSFNDSNSAFKPTKLYFMPYNSYTIRNDTISYPGLMEERFYKLDEQAKTLFLFHSDSNSSVSRFSYNLQNDSILILKGLDEPVVFTYKKRVMNTRYRH